MPDRADAAVSQVLDKDPRGTLGTLSNRVCQHWGWGQDHDFSALQGLQSPMG